jgi:hypothetical protein
MRLEAALNGDVVRKIVGRQHPGFEEAATHFQPRGPHDRALDHRVSLARIESDLGCCRNRPTVAEFGSIVIT